MCAISSKLYRLCYTFSNIQTHTQTMNGHGYFHFFVPFFSSLLFFSSAFILYYFISFIVISKRSLSYSGRLRFSICFSGSFVHHLIITVWAQRKWYSLTTLRSMLEMRNSAILSKVTAFAISQHIHTHTHQFECIISCTIKPLASWATRKEAHIQLKHPEKLYCIRNVSQF